MEIIVFIVVNIAKQTQSDLYRSNFKLTIYSYIVVIYQRKCVISIFSNIIRVYIEYIDYCGGMEGTSSWCPWNGLKLYLANALRKLTECNFSLGILTNTVVYKKFFLRAKPNDGVDIYQRTNRNHGRNNRNHQTLKKKELKF